MYRKKDIFDVVFYHKNCADGIAGAWVLWRDNPHALFIGISPSNSGGEDDNDKENKNSEGEKEEFVPSYPFEDTIKGKSVIMVDVTFSRKETMFYREISKAFLVLDHHISAERKIGDLDCCIIDTTRSGCQIAWDFMTRNLIPRSERPWFIDVIADRDLWKWEIPFSKEYNMALKSGKSEIHGITNFISFPGFDFLFDRKHYKIELLRQGKEMKVTRDQKIKDVVDRTIVSTRYFKKIDKLYKVGYVTLEKGEHNLRSDVGSEIMKNHDDIDFAMITRLSDDEKSNWVSLRGLEENGIDLSKIADAYGGGGHKLAAGYTTAI